MIRLSSVSSKTDKDFVHNTIHVYESLFEPIKNRVSSVLEIGIYTGNSHRMWRDYFSNAIIYGIDIENNCGGMEDEDRILTFFEDAYTSDLVNFFNGIKFDIIIDDGPHTLESQIFVVANYSRLLADNGILVVEDIPDIEWVSALTQNVPEELRKYSYAIDRRSAAPNSLVHDEILFVIDKRFV